MSSATFGETPNLHFCKELCELRGHRKTLNTKSYMRIYDG